MESVLLQYQATIQLRTQIRFSVRILSSPSMKKSPLVLSG